METLPLIHYVAKKFGDNIFQDCIILSVFHLLDDSIHFFEAMAKMGAHNEDTYIIGIPYSNKERSVEKLRGRGYHVFVPNFPIDECVSKTIDIVYNRCKKEKKRLLIIEDGGHVVPRIHESSGVPSFVVGAVEQTARGVWIDKSIKLEIPVLTVAFSDFKKELEAPEVGKAVMFNLEQLLSERTFLRGKKVGIMGFGTIGKNVAQYLKHSGCIVKISEIDVKKAVIAQLMGFEHSDSVKVVRDCEIIIGTTGRTSLGLDEILAAKNNTVFASASSRQVEIDKTILEQMSTRWRVLPTGTEYKLINGNHLLVLAHGFPINFYCSESVPNKIIDFILSEILESAARLVTDDFPPGVHEGCISEDELAEIFYKVHFG